MTVKYLPTGAPSPSEPLNWNSIDWKTIGLNVGRLQMRIAKATKEKRYGKVKALQWLLSHSLHAKLLAVRKVTQSSGARTPGVDRVVWTTPKQKVEAVQELKRRGYRTKPLRRVYTLKKNGKKRPLGIPVIKDRAMQALHLLTLEPVAETTADKHSYGFRRMRSTADAITQCYKTLGCRGAAEWIFEADIKGCFDNISHEWMLEHIPMDKILLQKWLKAGYMEDGALYSTDVGTPQGGVISPTLANMVLDGLENAVIAVIRKRHDKVHVIRYADDFIVTGISVEVLEKIKTSVQTFLLERGLALSCEKTKITHISAGFNFLGFTIRRYGKKVFTKPSKESISSFLAVIRQFIKSSTSKTTADMICFLNPRIRGWANYYRHCVAKRVFSYIDMHIFRALWQWARRRHSNKNTDWIRRKYFRSKGLRNWVFSATAMYVNGKGTVVHELLYASTIPIKRHIKIRSDANPFDPAYYGYLHGRRQRLKASKESTSKHLGLLGQLTLA